MLRTFATSSSGPTPNRVLFWNNGRLIIAATGLSAALARSAWSCASAADGSGSSSDAANSQSCLGHRASPVLRFGGTSGGRTRAPANSCRLIIDGTRWLPCLLTGVGDPEAARDLVGRAETAIVDDGAVGGMADQAHEHQAAPTSQCSVDRDHDAQVRRTSRKPASASKAARPPCAEIPGQDAEEGRPSIAATIGSAEREADLGQPLDDRGPALNAAACRPARHARSPGPAGNAGRLRRFLGSFGAVSSSPPNAPASIVLPIEGSWRTARLLTLQRPKRRGAVGPKRMIGWLARFRSTEGPTSEA